MGSKPSKIASAARRYPTRTLVPSQRATSPSSGSPADAGPTVHPQTQTAAYEKSDAIRQDAADPDFAKMLKTVGAVQISDAARSFSLADSKNPQLRTLHQRQYLVEKQLEESTDPRTRGKRSWVDVQVIREILRLRDERKWDAAKIEQSLGLADGVVKRLGSSVRNV